jgi:hypothetical protein
MAIMTEDWGKVRSFYADLYARQRTNKTTWSGMLSLVDAIVDSPYRDGLFPWTSVTGLCITQTEVEFPYKGPKLKIEPQRDGWVELSYGDLTSSVKPWRRRVKADDAFARLEKFFDELSWFVKYQTVDELERRETR